METPIKYHIKYKRVVIYKKWSPTLIWSNDVCKKGYKLSEVACTIKPVRSNLSHLSQKPYNSGVNWGGTTTNCFTYLCSIFRFLFGLLYYRFFNQHYQEYGKWLWQHICDHCFISNIFLTLNLLWRKRYWGLLTLINVPQKEIWIYSYFTDLCYRANIVTSTLRKQLCYEKCVTQQWTVLQYIIIINIILLFGSAEVRFDHSWKIKS